MDFTTQPDAKAIWNCQYSKQVQQEVMSIVATAVGCMPFYKSTKSLMETNFQQSALGEVSLGMGLIGKDVVKALVLSVLIITTVHIF